ncbi:MAG: hypothetical protein GY913_27110 [Proteobacteria bacterium]|nr:hypothetical protein [Pseudomonadota bacterium]MCP4920585.1 hypothetical protein [Pseudomonadota bacterium]
MLLLVALLGCGDKDPPQDSAIVEADADMDADSDTDSDADADTDADSDADSDADTDPTYDADIVPLFEANCTDYGCHLNRESINSLDATVAYGFLTTEMSEDIPSMPKVDPGDPENSYLFLKLEGTHVDAGGAGARMPKGQDPLSAEELALVEAWIDAGAPEN